MKILRRKPASIANGRWAAYATAGVASAFTCANSAEATIHYSGPINRIFNGCLETATFRLDRAGDFIRLRHSSLVCSSRGYSGSGFFNVGGLAGASIAGFYNECPFNPVSASNLERGQLISHRPVVPAQTQSAVLTGEGSICNGQFAGRGIGYIGFKFNNGSGDQFGWARIQTQAAISHHFILRDYAYGDVGDRIRAGQKSGHEMVTDEGSLGWLALGAVGLLAWRKSRSRKTLTFLVS
jgi:hypothetical protein